MRNYFLIFILLFCISTALSQELSGLAEYTIRESSDELNDIINDPTMDPNMRKFIESKMENTLTKNYTLTFDNHASKFVEQQKLLIENDGTDMSWSPYGIDIAFYKNLASHSFIIEKDLMGKIFCVQDSLPILKWQLLNESKMIGTFTCKKAIVEFPVSAKQMEEYLLEKTRYNNKSTQFFTLKEPTPKKVIAWYTTDIPIMNGPFEYGGLPGLILELSDASNIIVCYKVVLDKTKKRQSIQFPTSKLISVKRFKEISDSKLKELENQN